MNEREGRTMQKQERKNQPKKKPRVYRRPEPASLPSSELVALSQILAAMNIAASTWWQGVKSGKFPKPVKLGPRCVRWRTEHIRQVCAGTWQTGRGTPTSLPL